VLDHVPPVAPPPTVPPRPLVTPLEQIVWLPPTATVAAARMVTTIFAVAAPIPPVVVNVSVTVPAVQSPADD
jgi:hypothetical protein